MRCDEVIYNIPTKTQKPLFVKDGGDIATALLTENLDIIFVLFGKALSNAVDNMSTLGEYALEAIGLVQEGLKTVTLTQSMIYIRDDIVSTIDNMKARINEKTQAKKSKKKVVTGMVLPAQTAAIGAAKIVFSSYANELKCCANVTTTIRKGFIINDRYKEATSDPELNSKKERRRFQRD